MTDDLNKLTTKELGALFPVIIVDYNPDWKNLYSCEEQNIKEAIGSKNVKRIQHIGSTAVPGLCAKPTIDILIEISDDTDCNLFINSLKKIQYQYIPEPENPPPHITLVKGYAKTGFIGQAFHLHVRYFGDWDEIVFRDYLIINSDIAQEYGDLKRRLSIEYRNDREMYTESKTDFIKRIVKISRDHFKNDIGA